MKELLRFAWDVSIFKHDAYARHVASANVLKRGLLLLVVVTLLAGSISFLIDLVGGIITPPAEQMEQGIQDFVATLQQFVPAEALEPFLEGFIPGMNIAIRIASLPTPLPQPLATFLSILGAFLSAPFTRLTGWAAYAIWVILVARLLGGKGHIPQMLGATALYVIPHILDIFDFIPFLGWLIGVVATLWGIAIYVKGLAAANEFGIGKAILAAILPALALIGLGLLIALVNFVVIAIAG